VGGMCDNNRAYLSLIRFPSPAGLAMLLLIVPFQNSLKCTFRHIPSLQWVFTQLEVVNEINHVCIYALEKCNLSALSCWELHFH
jgi:hypothetical protein